MKKIWWMIACLAVFSAACGDSDSTSAGASIDDPRVQEVADVLKGDEDFPIEDSEAECAASRLVGDLPDDAIQLMLDNPDGDITESVDAETAVLAFDGILDCVDIRRAMVESMVADGSSQEEAECMADVFGEDELREFLAMSVQPEAEMDDSAALALLGKIFEAAGDCGLDLG